MFYLMSTACYALCLGSEWAGLEETLATPLQIASGVMDRYDVILGGGDEVIVGGVAMMS